MLCPPSLRQEPSLTLDPEQGAFMSFNPTLSRPFRFCLYPLHFYPSVSTHITLVLASVATHRRLLRKFLSFTSSLLSAIFSSTFSKESLRILNPPSLYPALSLLLSRCRRLSLPLILNLQLLPLLLRPLLGSAVFISRRGKSGQ